MPLTDVVVRAATSQSRTRKLFDGRGLYLEISPSGGRWWRWKYRVGGKEKRLSLGVYPDVSLKAARARREAVRQQLAAGIDPGQARKAQKLALTGADSFEAVAREWHAKFSAGWVPRHGGRILRRLEHDLFPWLGQRPLAATRLMSLRGAVRRAAPARTGASDLSVGTDGNDNVDGVIGSTARIGSTPNTSRWSSMNWTIGATSPGG